MPLVTIRQLPVPACALMLAVLAGCGGTTDSAERVEASQGETSNATATGATSATSTATTTSQTRTAKGSVGSGWSNPTTDEAHEFATQLQNAVVSADVKSVDLLIDWQAVLDRGIGDLDVPAPVVRDFSQGFLSQIAEGNGLSGAIVSNVMRGGDFRVLSLYTEGDEQRVLCRMPAPGYLDYFNFLLKKQADGSVRAVDVHDVLAGESMSKILRRGLLDMVARNNQPVGGASREEQVFLDNYQAVSQFGQFISEGRPAEALDAYDKLPEALKHDKQLLVLRSQAAWDMGEAPYQQAIDEFHTHFPQSACIDLRAIDGHAVKQRYDAALASVDLVEQKIARDPYLNVVRANMYLAMGEVPKARAAAENALASEGDLLPAYWVMFYIAIEEQNFPQALAVLKQIDSQFQMEFDDFTKNPELTEFVASPEYQQWLAYLSENRPAAPDAPVNVEIQ